MNQQPVVSLNASGGALLLNLSQLVFEHRQLLQLSRRKEEEAYFVDYIPPARDAITLPRNVVYVLNWILGPKPVEDDSEEGDAEIEEERRLSASSKLTKTNILKMEKEKDGPLPGFHLVDAGCLRPSTLPPPLRSAIAPSYPGEKR
ncbi:hypothetical protein L3Q82_021540, partial [Scortum barcoo]